MEEVVADEVTKHLFHCKECRQKVISLRNRVPSVVSDPGPKDRAIKIQCSTCDAKYSVPEDRVRGRTLTIRCKTCNDLIEVRSTGGTAGPLQQQVTTPQKVGPDKVWYVVLRRQRVGPLSEREIFDLFSQGEINQRTYAWRKSYSKWERLSEIREFARLVEMDRDTLVSEPFAEPGVDVEPAGPDDSALRTAYPPVERTVKTAAPTSADQGADSGLQDRHMLIEPGQDGPLTMEDTRKLTRPGQREPNQEVDPASARPSITPEDRSAVGDTLPGGRPRELSASMEPEEWDSRMKGQRGDDSVLFSLRYLQDLSEKSSPDAAAGGSGLFDIRPLPGMAVSPFTLALESSGKSGQRGLWIFLLVGGVGMVLGAALLLGILLLSRPDIFSQVGQAAQGTQQQALQAPPVRVMAQPDAEAPSPAPDSHAAADAQAPAPLPDSGATADEPETAGESTAFKPSQIEPAQDPARRQRSKPEANAGASLPGQETGETGGDTSSPPPDEIMPIEGDPPAPRSERRSTEPASQSELDRLIEAATSRSYPPPADKKRRSSRPRKAKSEPREDLPTTLPRDQVASGMRRANHLIHLCARRHNQVGVVMTKVTILGKTGRITRGSVLGAFAGTPAGACVLDAVRRGARFPRFSDAQLTLKYPFVLR